MGIVVNLFILSNEEANRTKCVDGTLSSFFFFSVIIINRQSSNSSIQAMGFVNTSRNNAIVSDEELSIIEL